MLLRVVVATVAVATAADAAAAVESNQRASALIKP